MNDMVELVKTGQLSLVVEAPRLLADIAQISDTAVLKEQKAQAVAIAVYLAQRRDQSVEEHNAALKIKLRIEHRLGEVLAETVKHGGHNKEQGDILSPCSNGGLPADISNKQSSRAQQLAALPWQEIEVRIDAKTEGNEKASQNRILKELRREVQIQELAAEPPPLPEGPFRVIAIDPPWTYWKRNADATHQGTCPYPCMTLEEIAALPIASLACPDSIVWLWTTNAHMEEAFRILRGWGFEHKTILTWAKSHFGTGDWLRGQTEHCLMAVRGHPIVTLTNQSTVIHGPSREHSRKPEEFYKLVESLCPGSKVELFARCEREGWVSHGNDTNAFQRVALSTAEEVA
jgi:N6-adenosine-specific RNA methylase IME4